MRTTLMVGLRPEGIDVVPCSSALEAVQFLARETPDAVVCDLRMADASGLQVINTARANAHADLPIVVYTGVSRSDPMWYGEEWGWDAYVEKPAKMSDLARTIREVIAKARDT